MAGKSAYLKKCFPYLVCPNRGRRVRDKQGTPQSASHGAMIPHPQGERFSKSLSNDGLGLTLSGQKTSDKPEFVVRPVVTEKSCVAKRLSDGFMEADLRLPGH
jgi:hypothetical protein